jgi:hypothetical protein
MGKWVNIMGKRVNHSFFQSFHQQHKLMGSSAQKSSGVQCRCQVRFNEVPEKVPENVWEVLVQSQIRFNRVPGNKSKGLDYLNDCLG